MKRAFVLILLTGAFLGGYYLGHLPNSPDIFAWGRETFEQAVEMGHEVQQRLGWETDREDSDAAASDHVPFGAYLTSGDPQD